VGKNAWLNKVSQTLITSAKRTAFGSATEKKLKNAFAVAVDADLITLILG
jgi:hypothetical protein